MIKRKIVEVVEEYNESGKLVRKTTTETTEDDDVKVQWYPYTVPNTNPNDYQPYWGICPPNGPNQPTVTYTTPGADCVPPRDFTTICNAINGTNIGKYC